MHRRFRCQESKTGRALVDKCQALRKENEALGRTASEGRVQRLEAAVGQLRDYISDLKKSYMELESHAAMVDEENEDLQVRFEFRTAVRNCFEITFCARVCCAQPREQVINCTSESRTFAAGH